VQRNPIDAQAWFELGVKQQENEREQKAIQALERALALDPAHLSAHLALAISYTNEGQRAAAHEAVASWLTAHPRHGSRLAAHRAADPDTFEHGLLVDKVQGLVNCLIGLAQEEPDGSIDADVQIALAILLNINEVSRRRPA
jgi:peroxin-5